MTYLNIGLSFLEGLALIASPCILPVLPLILGASSDSGKARPFGIITGFVFAFTAFALFARSLVNALGIDLDIIKYGSLILLAVFALTMLSNRLSERFAALSSGLAALGNHLPANEKGGFTSGMLIGMLIGLVWTPCAGPILASVLVQIIREQSDITAFLLIASFAIGAGIPMLIISLMGRKILTQIRSVSRHSETVRKCFGVLILFAVAFIATGADIRMILASDKPMPFKTLSDMPMSDDNAINRLPQGLVNALPSALPAPEFEGISTWLNSAPQTIAALKGKVVLIDFWTYSCINCIRTLPTLTRFDTTYRDKGLVIIGVHAPEFEFEKKVSNIEAAIARYNIKYPVAVDNTLDTWSAYKNRYWPAHYLINKEGQIVYTHFGEGGEAITEHNIRTLLGLSDDKDSSTPPQKNLSVISANQTPETYLGAARAARFSSPEKGMVNTTQSFSFPASLSLHRWALSGKWQIESERSIAKHSGAALRLHFTAGKVFLVLGTADGKPIEASLTLNGKPLGAVSGADVHNGIVTVDSHRLYALIDQTDVSDGVVEITAKRAGLEVYAFTFGR